MGRETKIGLLVGMCFIVCFAIILSHRGDVSTSIVDRVTGYSVSPAVVEPNARRDAADRAASTSRRLPATGRRAQAAPNRRPQSARTAAATRRQTDARRPAPADARTITGAASRAGNPAPSARASAPRRPAGRSRPRTQPGLDHFTTRGEPIAAAPFTRPQSFSLREPATGTPSTAASADPRVARSPSDGAPRRQTRAISPAEPLTLQPPPPLPGDDTERDRPPAVKPPVSAGDGHAAGARAKNDRGRADEEITAGLLVATRPKTTYTVQPGDSLSRVAARHYGAATPEVIERVLEANAPSLKSADMIYAGQKIVLPEMASAQAAGEAIAQGSASTGNAVAADRATTGVRSRSEPEVEVVTAYVIQAGDTLTKIAQAHYGTAAGEITRLICERNRSSIANPDLLIAGKSILLPRLPAAPSASGGSSPAGRVAARDAAPSADQSDERAVAASRSGGGEGVDWRWYELKKGDMYSTVAQVELGTSRRWRELARLNEDIFPDAGQIRYGVKIRIPLGTVGSTGARRDRGGA